MTVYGFDDAMNKVAISGGGTGRVVSTPLKLELTGGSSGNMDGYRCFGVKFGLGSVSETESGGSYYIPYDLVPTPPPAAMSSDKPYATMLLAQYSVNAGTTVDISSIVGASFTGRAVGMIISHTYGILCDTVPISGTIASGVLSLDKFILAKGAGSGSIISLVALDWFPS